MKLSAFKPSSDDLEEARKILAGLTRSQVRARKGTMQYFLTKVSQEGTEHGKRGKELNTQLEKFVAYQQVQKNAKQVVKSSESFGSSSQDHREVHLWTEETMRLKLGNAKTDHWIQSGLLRWQPDSLTGSKDKNVIEYMVPVLWTTKVGSHDKHASIGGEDEASGGRTM